MSAKKKPVAKAKAKAKPAVKAKAKKAKTKAKTKVPPAPRSSSSEVYGGMVAEIIDSRERSSTFRPKIQMNLSITRRRMPTSSSELVKDEQEQLSAVFGKNLDAPLNDPEVELEVAEVTDEKGTVRYRLYGWNYGVGYLFPAKGLSVVGFGSQHDIEHWNLPQRDVFFAMDYALQKKGHGFQQPLSFCWWDDACWKELEDGAESESYMKKRLATKKHD